MPRGKRKAASSSSSSSADKKMWNSKKKNRSAGSGSSSSNNLSGINEASAEKMFAEIADPDDPQSVNMDGMYAYSCCLLLER